MKTNELALHAFLFALAVTSVSCPDGKHRETEKKKAELQNENIDGMHENWLELIHGASLQGKEYKTKLNQWLATQFRLDRGQYTIVEVTQFLAQPSDDIPSIILSGKWESDEIVISEPLNATRYKLLMLLMARCGGSFYLDDKARVVFEGPL